jgi:hypothetical protein
VRVAGRGDRWRDGEVEGENGRVVRNRNGDLIPPDAAQSVYCSTCSRYVGKSGKRVSYDSDDIIVWAECDGCRGRREAAEAVEAERRRREEEKVRPVVCQLDGCSVMFVRQAAQQKFCCDEHRWQAHRQTRKAGRRLRLVKDDHRAA